MTETNENEILYHEEIVETCEIKPNPRVLMIVTNSDHFDEHHKTGVWFEEFAIPYLKFKEEGFFVTTSSLNGGPAPIDPASENIIDDIKWHEAKKALEDTTPLESIDYNFYDAVVFPGGHGPMFDIAESELIGEIVSSFDKKKKLIAAICHGPAGLLKAMSDRKAFVNEKKLTCFTNSEETSAKKDKLTPFSLEDALKEKGALFIALSDGAVNVIKDKNLITAQNYQSAEEFALAVIKYLKNNQNNACSM